MPHTSSTPQLDRSRIDPVLDPIVQGHGGEVVDVELKSEATGWVLRVYVERLGSAARKATTQDAAVDLDLCSRVARELSPALDVADVIPHRYHLEVSSPGLERPLRRAQDYERFVGQKAKLKLHTSVAGQKVLVGTLQSVQGDRVHLEADGKAHAIALPDIANAHLVFEFGPTPKPGGAKRNRAHGGRK